VSTQLFDQENYEVATAIAEVDSKQLAPNDPMAIIAMAVQSGCEPAQLRELLELQREYAKDRAAEAYGAAITRFQQLCPRIHKGREVNAGPLRYQFASYDDVMLVAGPHLSACGIALSFSTEKNDTGIRVTCRIRVGTHAEDCTLDVPVPDMKVNNTQRYGAALSYAKRYALCAALNIVVTDDVDDDGASCHDPITEEQEVELRELLEAKGGNLEKFCVFMGVKQLSEIPVSDFPKAIAAVRSKR
jgi:hypothetical protein